MFICCRKPENGCNGVPNCKCECSGCEDQWERFSIWDAPISEGPQFGEAEDDYEGGEERILRQQEAEDGFAD